MLLERYRVVVVLAVFVAAVALIGVPPPACADPTTAPEQPAENQPEEPQPGPVTQPLKLGDSASVAVTVHAFSGVPDPKWELKPGQIAKLASMVDALEPVNLDKPLEPPSRLGYKGFSLKARPKQGSNVTLFVYDDTIQGPESFGSRKGTGHQLERWLMSTAGRSIKRHVQKVVLKDIGRLAKKPPKPNVNRAPTNEASQDSSPGAVPDSPK
jgi:hypothetical protein